MLVIGLSERSVVTLQNRMEWSELATYSGVSLGLASHGVLGKKRESTLTLRIRDPSFGVDILANNMLCSMNLEAVSTFRTCSDGWIVIRSQWKLKDLRSLSLDQRYGSLATFIQGNGTPNWT